LTDNKKVSNCNTKV